MESSNQSAYQGIKMNSHDQDQHIHKILQIMQPRASEGNDQVIMVAANLLKKVTDTRAGDEQILLL